MTDIEHLEIIGPNKDVIEMTKIILRQHDEIIKINSILSSMLANPIMYIPRDKAIGIGSSLAATPSHTTNSIRVRTGRFG